MANLEICTASAHNLKGIGVTIPHQRFTCVCGVSGSGKSSLVYDIIERESKKRFFESFSAYARQKIGKMGRARAERITGLLPVISLRQHISASGSRSTAGTMCGVDELLRLLFARFGAADDAALLLTRSLFSRNTPQGMCAQCRGLGHEEYIDEQRIIDDETRSLRERALRVTLKDGYTVYSQVTLANLDIVCRHHGFTVDTPLCELTSDQRRVLFYGSDAVEITYGKHTLTSRLKWQGMVAKPPEQGFYKGIIPVMSEILARDRNPNILRFCSSRTCSACEGSGLNEAARSVTFEGRPITWYSDRTFGELNAFMASYAPENPALQKVVRDLGAKTRWLCRLGLEYIAPSRTAPTLSGGEAQRVRLVGALGIGLKNIMYLLDEPTAGLHLKDSNQMIRLFHELTAQGNTVVVVEHDRNTILSSDHLIEIGPGSGYMGGEVVYQGPTAAWVESAYKRELCGEVSPPHGAETTRGGEEALFSLSGITFRNLKNIDVSLKLSALNVVCGVSGSGKSSLVMHELPRRCLHDPEKAPGVGFTRIIEVTNAPMGRTSRSNPATYTGVFNEIRKRFAATPLARERGYKATHFSFNTSKGSCDECKGHGRLELGLHFMENYTVRCPSCGGQRFKEAVLEVTLMGKNIAQVLELEVDEALTFFAADAKISEWLQILTDLGLGYVKLGQSSVTLSGGEAQRLRLASELGKKTGRESLILLDEPSRGLSAHETELLLVNLRRLAAKGATVVFIEHDPQLIWAAERVIELGPDSGEKGGEVIFQGSPQAFAGCTDSPTVRAMREPVTLADVSSESTDTIGLYGVTTNNLKNIDVKIPQCALTVVSGGSGSGKRSLAVQTLYNESWQRYASSLSGYVRRFVGNKTHADVRRITNLLPAILISGSGSNRRGTVATVSGIYDYLRLLYARFATYHCPRCGSTACACGTERQHKPSASLFSFNLNQGACDACGGLGRTPGISEARLMGDPGLTLFGGLISATKPGAFYADPNGQYMATLAVAARKYGVDITRPWRDFSPRERQLVLHGCGDEIFDVVWEFSLKKGEGSHRLTTTWPGFINLIEADYLRNLNNKKVTQFASLIEERRCTACDGRRLKPEVLGYRYGGLSIAELCAHDIAELGCHLPKTQGGAAQIIDEIQSKIEVLTASGLGYLSLDRRFDSLSGGEKQRLQLAGLIAENMSGILYILDAPARGLRFGDTDFIVENCRQLIAQGNTMVLTDPKQRFYERADHLVVLNRGEVSFQGKGIDFKKESHALPPFLAPVRFFSVGGAHLHNLKNIDVAFGYNTVNVVHGISGSGKTTLVFGVLGRSWERGVPVGCETITGDFSKVIVCDGVRDTRNVDLASHLGVRELLLKRLAKENGLTHKKVTTSEIICPDCKGEGELSAHLDLVADVSYVCETCRGTGFKSSILNYEINGLNIAQVFDAPLSELGALFAGSPVIPLMERLVTLGLGHLRLRQKLKEMSLLRQQLLKIAVASPKEALILMDEPAAELSPVEVVSLHALFGQLLTMGATVVITEHDPLLIMSAGHSIELGPAAGPQGGSLMGI